LETTYSRPNASESSKKAYTFLKAKLTTLLLTICIVAVTSFSAQPTYSITDLVAGNIPGISLYTIGTAHTNLELKLRIVSNSSSSFYIQIPEGTVFHSSQLAKRTAGSFQDFIAPFTQNPTIPFGGNMPKRLEITAGSYTCDVPIYALCFNVTLAAPDTSVAVKASLDNTPLEPQVTSMLQALGSFNQRMNSIDLKIQNAITLTDSETNYAGYIDWNRDTIPGQWRALPKQLASATYSLQSPVRSLAKTVRLKAVSDSLTPEMSRSDVQNVIWASKPKDSTYNADTIVNQIQNAIHLKSIAERDSLMFRANRFMYLLGIKRKLFVSDSLIYPISHDIPYPPYYGLSWDGVGAGFALRMTPPNDMAGGSYRWQVMEISYNIQSNAAGTFQAAILENANGIPGKDLINRRLVSFNAVPNGTLVKIDVSNENLVINKDFFVAFFQTSAGKPDIVLSLANNNRSFSFDNVFWAHDSSNLSIYSKVKRLDWAATKGASLAEKNEIVGLSIASFSRRAAILKYFLRVTSRVDLQFFNVNGRLLWTVKQGLQQPGLHSLSLNDIPSLQSAGCYIVKLFSANNAVSQVKLP